LVFAAIWLAVAGISRMSSAAALVAAAASPAVLWALGERQMAEVTVVLVVLLWWRHRENIARLLAGTESRIGRKT
jgi:glycerol-3-phosphate acyltransferase PlsY